MPLRVIASLVSLAFVGAVVGACGRSATPAPPVAPSSEAAPPASAATATATATPRTAASGGDTWTVSGSSKATVSVREQLVGVSLPSDAVLTATGAAGSFTLRADGTFAPDSRITFDLGTLTSDESNRDNYVKRSTLAVQQFPSAAFVPTKASGLALPLAASADLTFSVTGDMTIHGVTKPLTFTVTAKKSATQLTATATATPALTFAQFGMTAPAVPFRVASVADEIRLVITLVAAAG